MGKVPEQKEAAKKKVAAPMDESARLKLYITKINAELNRQEKVKHSLSYDTLEEAEMLVDHAVCALAKNAGAVLKYSQTETFGPKTAKAAARVTFSGLLRDVVVAAGDKAVEEYVRNTPKPQKKMQSPAAVTAGGD